MVSLGSLGLDFASGGGFVRVDPDVAMLSAYHSTKGTPAPKAPKSAPTDDRDDRKFIVNAMKKKKDVNEFEGLDASEILDIIKEDKPGVAKVRRAIRTLATAIEEEEDSDF